MSQYYIDLHCTRISDYILVIHEKLILREQGDGNMQHWRTMLIFFYEKNYLNIVDTKFLISGISVVKRL